MKHFNRWVIANPMASGHESPDQIDVLAGSQRFIEATDVTDCVGATYEHGRRDVRESGPGPHRSLSVAKVERPMSMVISSTQPGPRTTPNSWGDSSNSRILEMGEQRLEPTTAVTAVTAGVNISIDEGAELSRHHLDATVTSRCWTQIVLGTNRRSLNRW